MSPGPSTSTSNSHSWSRRCTRHCPGSRTARPRVQRRARGVGGVCRRTQIKTFVNSAVDAKGISRLRPCHRNKRRPTSEGCRCFINRCCRPARVVRGADAPGLPSEAELVGLGQLFRLRSGFKKQLRLPAGSRPPSRRVPPPPAGCVSMPTSSGQRSLSNLLTSTTQLSKRRGNKEL